jgi:hypothetical protein
VIIRWSSPYGGLVASSLKGVSAYIVVYIYICILFIVVCMLCTYCTHMMHMYIYIYTRYVLICIYICIDMQYVYVNQVCPALVGTLFLSVWN